MIDFQKLDLSCREDYEAFLMIPGERGCEYSLANLFLWGRQRAAILDGYLVLFSQFEKRSVYPFPVGRGDIRPVLDAIISDAKERGIVCRLSSLSAAQCMLLEELYPGQFQFHPDRNSCDYVYSIEDLATLKGRKYQKKRNHLNKFRENHPDCRAVVLDQSNIEDARRMVQRWYDHRLLLDPDADFYLEQRAIRRAFDRMEALGIMGMLLVEDGEVLAMAMGSFLSPDTVDVHFEKAREDVDGAYPAINQAFAQWIHENYPQVRWLNREDDMGIPGLRKAKLSYCPDHMVEKFWARLWEADDVD
jgi:hypothetical protein